MDKSRPETDELSAEEWKTLKSSMQTLRLKNEEILFHEGSLEEELYFIEEGTMAVIKKGHEIATLNPGDWIGEIAALSKGKTRSATVKAKGDALLKKISLPNLKKVTQADPDIFTRVMTNLAKNLAYRLDTSNTSRLDSLQREIDLERGRIEMGHFLFYMLIAISAFIYLMKFLSLTHFSPKVNTVISIPSILMLGFFSLRYVKKTSYPLSEFGLTLKNWKTATVEALAYTIPIGLALFLIKWVIYQVTGSPSEKPFQHFHQIQSMHLPLLDWLSITIGYTLIVPLQAFMINGCFQGGLSRFFIGPHRILLSILLSNLIFSLVHLQISLQLSIGVFFIGCFWGWLYSKHQTIVGISVSHAILGMWVGIFLGFS